MTFIFPAYKSTYLVGIAKICVILAINRPFLLLLLPRYVTGTYIGKYKFSFHRSENTNLNRESCPPCMEFEGTFENIFTNSTFIFPAYKSTYLVGITKICVYLRSHLKTHSGEKSNKCNLCDYTSSQAGNLMQHLKKHSGEQLNKCNQCDSSNKLKIS